MVSKGPQVKQWGRWTDLGQIGRYEHVHRVVDDKGIDAVIKLRPKGRRARDRFAVEARNMPSLIGEEGVLPVLDVSSETPPAWFVTSEAKLIQAHLGQSPDLRDVVEVVSVYASTLDRLAQRPLAHRDLKPDNLFWLDGAPVIGDFGIANWDNRGALTKTGEKVGPAYFLAPEVRQSNGQIDWHAADVFSLAKTLFVLAYPERGKYPPGGAHVVGRPEFSLRTAGGRASDDLAPLIELATEHDPRFRPSMAEFRAELDEWLRLHPPTAGRRDASPFRKFTDPVVQQAIQRIKADERLAANLAMQVMRQITDGIDSVISWDGSTFTDAFVGDLGLDEHWEPDASQAWTSTWTHTGRRLALGMIVDNGGLHMFAEGHERASPDTVGVARTLTGRLGMPSLQNQLRTFPDDLISFLGRRAPPPGSGTAPAE